MTVLLLQFISCLASQFSKDEVKVSRICWNANSKLERVVCAVLSLLMELSSTTCDKILWYVKSSVCCHITFSNKTKRRSAMHPPHTDCQHPQGSCRLQISQQQLNKAAFSSAPHLITGVSGLCSGLHPVKIALSSS